jgi:hypothetical protein
MLWPTRLESEVGRTGVNTEMGWIRAEMAHETFYSFLFYPLFSFLYFQVQFEFWIWIQTCAKFVLNLYYDFKNTNFGNV